MKSEPYSSGAPVRSRKLPAKYAGVLLPLLLSLIMTAVISAITTLLNLGLPPNVLHLWLTAWASSWMVAFPTLLIVLPLVRRMAAALVEAPGE